MLTTALPSTHVADIASVCAALADPTRLRILALLGDGEVCVCHIHESLDIPQPTASRHLAYLRKAGLVEGRRDGLWVHYRLATALAPHVRHAVDGVLHATRHCPEAAADGRVLARTTGQPVRSLLPMVSGCCAPPVAASHRKKAVSPRGARA
ncbi:MAG TPA: metalloregulator ArsR/SmtB family transcription factor [Luteitalea sp.]|nr:metalloregulator ArsR/SmtB family transcription factor [Luteitalea sp.]